MSMVWEFVPFSFRLIFVVKIKTVNIFSHFLFDYLPLNRVERRFWLRGRGYDIRRNVSARRKIRNWTAIRLLKFEIFMHLIFCSNASKSNKLHFHVEDCTVSIEIPICMVVYAIITHFLCFCDWMTYSYEKKVSTWFYKLPTRIQQIHFVAHTHFYPIAFCLLSIVSNSCLKCCLTSSSRISSIISSSAIKLLLGLQHKL